MVSKGAVISKRIGLITNSRRYISLRQIRTGVRIFFWTILVVLTLSLSSLCILLDSCRPR